MRGGSIESLPTLPNDFEEFGVKVPSLDRRQFVEFDAVEGFVETFQISISKMYLGILEEACHFRRFPGEGLHIDNRLVGNELLEIYSSIHLPVRPLEFLCKARI